MTGSRIAHYEIVGKLGEGGMGIVYKARDTHLDRFVAVKILPPDRVADPLRIARFSQEAKAASALNHPNIVTIHDIAAESGIDFIVMEYVAGKTLEQSIPRSGMRLSEGLRVAVQIADALSRAHATGIIHRDLKPTNIMVDDHGAVKILDFGLAKLTEQAVSEDAATESIKAKTEEGVIVGTAAYMSPEQAAGRHIDARSDIFTFGAVLYEMVTGQRAFQGDSRMSTLAAVINKDPAPLPEALPPELRKIIERCLRKDPARRYQHMEDVRVVLEDLREESESGAFAPAEAARTKRRIWWQIAAVATICLAVVAAAVYWMLQEDASRARQAAEATVRPLTSYPGTEHDPTISPDGNQVAFCWNGQRMDNFDIYVQSIDSSQPVRLTTHPAPETRPAWSPDGKWIAYFRTESDGHSLMLMTPLGKSERKLAHLPLQLKPYNFYVPPLCWTVDSRGLIVTWRQEQVSRLAFYSMRNEEHRTLTNPPPDSYGDIGASISSDGRQIAFARFVGGGTAEIVAAGLGADFLPAGETRRLAGWTPWVGPGAWLPNNREYIFPANRSLWRTAAVAAEQPQRIAFAEDVDFTSTIWIAQAGERARIAYARWTGEENIWRVQLGGSDGQRAEPERLVASTRGDAKPNYSPDGKRLTFTSNRSGEWEVWVAEADGTNPSQLTALGKPCDRPRWSPDGNWIAFDSLAEDTWEVYAVRADGGSPRRLTKHKEPMRAQTGPTWSRDGQWIYYSAPAAGSGKYDLWKVPLAGGAAVQVTREGGYLAVESPDRKTLFFTKEEFGALWKMPLAGGPEQQVLEQTPALGFVPGHDGIWFFPGGRSDATRELKFLDFASGKVSSRSGPLGWLQGDVTVSPDRRYALYTKVDQPGSDLMLVENFR